MVGLENNHSLATFLGPLPQTLLREYGNSGTTLIEGHGVGARRKGEVTQRPSHDFSDVIFAVYRGSAASECNPGPPP